MFKNTKALLASGLALAASSMALDTDYTSGAKPKRKSHGRSSDGHRIYAQPAPKHIFETQAKYRHFMITASDRDIQQWNKALVAKRAATMRGDRLGQRRMEQLQRGL